MSQSKGLKRNTIDKFYTNESSVVECVSLFKKHVDPQLSDTIIEPSAGNGAFINGIKSISANYRFFDIDPEHEDVIKQDFLLFDYKSIEGPVHIIGNPPFGRQSSTAIRFIKFCSKFASSISFILPKSFKKDSMRKHFPPLFHLVFEQDMSPNSFTVNGDSYDVPCVFQIWIKKEHERLPIEVLTPKDFSFVKKDDNPDISFRRVGVNAGVVSPDVCKSEQSHYFIKFEKDTSIDGILSQLKQLRFDTDNTVGPKSISKQELIKEFNRIL